MGQLDRRQVVGVREEPRISEQQFGNFQCLEQVQKAKEGQNRRRSTSHVCAPATTF
jgi:hypothetical protein